MAWAEDKPEEESEGDPDEHEEWETSSSKDEDGSRSKSSGATPPKKKTPQSMVFEKPTQDVEAARVAIGAKKTELIAAASHRQPEAEEVVPNGKGADPKEKEKNEEKRKEK